MSRLIHRVFIFSLVLFTIENSTAQTYIELPVQWDFYRTNSDELNFERRGVVINPSIGIVLVGNDTSRFEGHLGVGLFISKFDHKVSDETFEYRALGLIHTSFTGYYNFSNRVQAGVGITFGWFDISEKGLNLDLDDEYRDRLGKGYNTINFGNSLDVRFNLDHVVSIGAKYTYWYLPQLEYRRIDDYGEFMATQRDLFLTRFELSIRFFIGGRQYDRR